MTFEPITNYQDFCTQLRRAGFSMGGDNNEGVFSLSAHFGPNIRWHTGDADTDPWAFRMRVLTEENDIGYGKLFFQKGGYMTREWAPCFLALKREGKTFEEIFDEGRMSYLERAICRFVKDKEEAAFHEIKSAVGERGLEPALAKLQTNMLLTISGQTMRLSKANMPYGWPVNTFRLTEDFWGREIMAKALTIRKEEAAQRIAKRVHELNPDVSKKALDRFLR